jgi:hypothetical protein
MIESKLSKTAGNSMRVGISGFESYIPSRDFSNTYEKFIINKERH